MAPQLLHSITTLQMSSKPSSRCSLVMLKEECQQKSPHNSRRMIVGHFLGRTAFGSGFHLTPTHPGRLQSGRGVGGGARGWNAARAHPHEDRSAAELDRA